MTERYYIEEGIEHAGNYNIVDRITNKMVAMSISGKDKSDQIVAKLNANFDLVNDHLYDGSGEVLVTYINNVKLVASDYLTDEMEQLYWITSHVGDMPAHDKQEFGSIYDLAIEMSKYEGWQVVQIEV